MRPSGSRVSAARLYNLSKDPGFTFEMQSPVKNYRETTQ